jgi:hypothetical protein
MIEAEVVEQEARRLGVTVSNAEIQKGVADAKKTIATQLMMQGTPMTFAEYARRDGVTEGLIAWSIRRQLLAQKAFGKSVEKDVVPLDGQIRTAHILIATVPLDPSNTAKPPTNEEAKKKIDEILAEIKGGKISFADAAKKYSDDKMSGERGGEIGWFGKSGPSRLDPAFEQPRSPWPSRTTCLSRSKASSVAPDPADPEGLRGPRRRKDRLAQAADRRANAEPAGDRAVDAGPDRQAKITTSPSLQLTAPTAGAKPAPRRAAAAR